jgi:hypothetical protein
MAEAKEAAHLPLAAEAQAVLPLQAATKPAQALADPALN